MSVKYTLTFILLTLFTLSLLGQKSYSVQGTIVDQDKNPVVAGNVLILSVEDQTLIKGDAFWKGEFEIEGLRTNQFLVRIVALGFTEKIITIHHTEASEIINIGTIQLAVKALEEVVVSAKKIPMFEQYGDRLVVNLENTSLSNSTSITEILQKTPRVIADENGSVSVFGKGQAVIFVDGQKMLSNDMLNTIGPGDVKQIEIITNPSAKYEASGKAIINIITKKNNLNGYHSTLFLGLTQRTYLQTYGSASMNYKKDRTNLYVRFAADPNRREFYEDDYERIFDATTNLNQRIEKVKKFKHRYFYKAGLEYSLRPNSTLGIQYSGAFRQGIENAVNRNAIQSNTDEELNIETLTNTEQETNLNAFNISYNYKPDSTDQYFNVIVDHSRYDFFKNDNINESFTGTKESNSRKRNYGENEVQLTTVQTNYLHPFKSLGLNVETGLRYTKIDNESLISFDLFQNETPVLIPERSNNYDYTEQVGAAYALLSKAHKRWYLKMGLRVEHTIADGFSKILNEQIVDKKYTHLFPSASVRYSVSDNLDMAISYSKRIQRPTIQDLDPFQFYIDSLSYYQGNPLLRPAITHASDLTITYRKHASITAGYAYTDHPMFLFVEQEENNSLVSIASMKNLKQSSKYFAALNLPYQIKGWTTFNVVGVEINDFNYTVNEIAVSNSKPLWYFYFHNDFKLGNGWSVEANYRYTTAGNNGIFEFQPRSNLSFAINKFLLNKKLNVSLSANDLLNKDRLRSSTVLDNLQLEYNSFYDRQYVRLNIRYKFGRLNKATYKDKTANRAERNRIKQ